MRTAHTTFAQQMMRHALLEQGYDRGASARHLWSGATTILRLGQWFRSPKKEPTPESSKGSTSIRAVRSASEKEKRDVGSVSSHTTNTGATLVSKKRV